MAATKKKKGVSLQIEFEEAFTVSGDGTFTQGDFAIGGGGVAAAPPQQQMEVNPFASPDEPHPAIKLVDDGGGAAAAAAAPAPAPAPTGGKKKKKGLSLDCDPEEPAGAPPAVAAAAAAPALQEASAPAPAQSGYRDDPSLHGGDLAGLTQDMAGGLSYDDLDKKEKLGAGASGTVWLVEDKKSKAVYALKQIPLEADEAKRKQLIIELKTMHECRCPFIVTCFGLFYVESAFYIVLELMDAGSLLDLLEKSPEKKLPENVIAATAQAVCGALRYLHETRRLIHRDLKPPNILVNKKGELKVADFGVSGVMSESKSVCASWVGTVTYMSPERIGGEKYGFRSDVWSMGLMLLECAVGRYPYITTSTPVSLSFWDLLDLIVDKPAPKVPHVGFSPEFRQFIMACLAKDPKRRPTASDCLEAPFLKMYADKPVNMPEFISSTLVNEAAEGIAKLDTAST